MTWSGIFRQFVYQYFLSFKGLQNGQTITRRCNSGGRWCGCAIHPPCGRGNILCFKRLLEFTELLIPVVMNTFVVKKKKKKLGGCVCLMDRNTENHEPILTSVTALVAISPWLPIHSVLSEIQRGKWAKTM